MTLADFGINDDPHSSSCFARSFQIIARSFLSIAGSFQSIARRLAERVRDARACVDRRSLKCGRSLCCILGSSR
jgi:hypothetical protein